VNSDLRNSWRLAKVDTSAKWFHPDSSESAPKPRSIFIEMGDQEGPKFRTAILRTSLL